MASSSKSCPGGPVANLYPCPAPAEQDVADLLRLEDGQVPYWSGLGLIQGITGRVVRHLQDGADPRHLLNELISTVERVSKRLEILHEEVVAPTSAHPATPVGEGA